MASMPRWGVFLAGLGLVAVSCGGADEPAATPTEKSITEMNRELFSWSTPYEQTTCAQWNGQMTDTEKAVAAQQLLSRLRTSDRAGAGSGGKALVTTFYVGMTNACQPVGTLTLTDAAAGLYLTDRDRFAP